MTPAETERPVYCFGGLFGDEEGVDFLGETGGGDVECGSKFLGVEECGVCGCYLAIGSVGVGAFCLCDAEECGVDNSFICL